MSDTNRSDPIQVTPKPTLAPPLIGSTAFSYDLLSAQKLTAQLSQDRMKKFLLRANNNQVLAIRLYEWNADLASSLYFPMQVFEVVVRNAIVRAIHQGVWGNNWYTDRRFIGITPSIFEYIEKALKKATEERNGFPISEPDIIAASTLGFWRELVKSDFYLHLWKKGQLIAFPNRSKIRNVTDIHTTIDGVLKLRNKIAHHDPILGALNAIPGKQASANYDNMLMLIKYIDMDTHRWVVAKSGFYSVYNNPPM